MSAQKLILSGFLILGLLIFTLSYVLVLPINKTLTQIGEFHSSALETIHIIKSDLTEAVEESFAYVVSGKTEERDEFLEWSEEFSVQAENFVRIAKLDKPEEKKDKELFDSIVSHQVNLVKYGRNMITEFEHSGAVSIKTFDEYESAVDSTTEILESYITLTKKAVAESQNKALLQIRQEKTKLFGIGMVTLILCIIFGWFLSQYVKQEIGQRRLAETKFRQRTIELELSNENLQAAHDTLEQRVRERTIELENSNKDLEDFASIASHDMHEPLRQVIAFGDQLLEMETQLSPMGKECLERMQNSTLRMKKLINNLLNFSRITSKPGSFEMINFKDVVNQAIENLGMLISDKGGTVVVGEMPTLEADLLQIRQLFQNLFSNSMKYHREGVPPVVEVKSALNPNGTWEIRIQDNGIGFEEKYAKRVFRMFERLHGLKDYDGSGIGLSICERIVTRHKGTITAESKVGEGTTFIVTLPEKQPTSD